MQIAGDVYTYISGFLGLAISLPFIPALTNTGPSHLIMLKATVKEMHANAIEAIKGAPSPRNVLIKTARLAPARASSLHVSARVSELELCIEIDCPLIGAVSFDLRPDSN